jgi:hypothetical protein
VAEILSVTIELTLDVITTSVVKAADLITVANLRGALIEDNIGSSFHYHTDKRSTLFWSHYSCLALSLWAEGNDALKLTLRLSIREHEIYGDIVLLKESKHGDFNRIPSGVINRLILFILHLETRVVVHDDTRLDDLFFVKMNILELLFFIYNCVNRSTRVIELLDSHLGSGERASLACADVVDEGEVLTRIILFNQQIVLSHGFSRKGHGDAHCQGETLGYSHNHDRN